MKNRSLTLQVSLSILPILLALAITAAMILAVGADPRAAIEKIWEGAFRDAESAARVINFWIPLTLASLGLVVTFTAGLWNIGIEGQMMMGAIFASWAALMLKLPSPILIPVEIIAAMVGGALWASLVGVLKIRLGVNEIFGGVALNALANIVSLYLIGGPWQPPEGGRARASAPFPAEALLPPISTDFHVNLLMLIIVAVALAVLIFALQKTRWGLQLKATGKNARSALLLGVPTQRTALTAFIACGMLAGIAGAYRVLFFPYTVLRPQASGGIGFLGLLVVLLVSLRKLWIPFVAFAFATLLSGSGRLQIALQLDPSLAGVLQETLVLVVLLFNGLRQRVQGRKPDETPDNVESSAGRGEPAVRPYEPPAQSSTPSTQESAQ